VAQTAHIPFHIKQNSIVLEAEANGQPTAFILDTGDAIGPVFSAEDAERLGLSATGEIGVSGAGGAVEEYSTVATITLDGLTYTDEPSAIDVSLGASLLGLPFFLSKASSFSFDLDAGVLTVEVR
jgi:predicted aspartyl protease